MEKSSAPVAKPNQNEQSFNVVGLRWRPAKRRSVDTMVGSALGPRPQKAGSASLKHRQSTAETPRQLGWNGHGGHYGWPSLRTQCMCLGWRRLSAQGKGSRLCSFFAADHVDTRLDELKKSDISEPHRTPTPMSCRMVPSGGLHIVLLKWHLSL